MYRILFLLLHILLNVNYVLSRDFYAGMMKKNDYLVAQDRFYKERVPYGIMYGKYGRKFKCNISYIRVVDRLGIGQGTKSQIIRGGLQHKYVVIRFTSLFNYPISVNVYVACPNIKKTTKVATTKAGAKITTPASGANKKVESATGGTGATGDGGGATGAAGGATGDGAGTGATGAGDAATTAAPEGK